MVSIKEQLQWLGLSRQAALAKAQALQLSVVWIDTLDPHQSKEGMCPKVVRAESTDQCLKLTLGYFQPGKT